MQVLSAMPQTIDLEQLHMTGQMATAALPLGLFLSSAKKSVVDLWSSVTHTLGHVADCSGLSSVVGVTCQADAEITGVDASAALPSRPVVDDGKSRPISSTSQLVLRLCIHHGEDLPLDKSYLEVVIHESSSEIKTLRSLAASSSSNPVWDFLVEEKVEVRANRVPNILIKVLSWQLIGPREIGSAFLMASVHGDQVHRQELTLKPAESFLPSLTKPRASKLMVAWQLCDESAFKPDLSRVAEMSSLALSKRFFRIEVAVKRIQLSKALVSAIPGVDLHADDFWDDLPDLCAQISCLKLDEAGKKEEAVVYQEDLKVEAVPRRGKGKHHVLFRVKEETVDGEDGDDGKGRSHKRKIERHLRRWELLENEISLMNYEVHFRVIMTPKETNQKTAQEPVRRKILGAWKGSLANLHDKIMNSQRKQHFAAQLLTNHSDKMRVGLMEVIFDISEAGADLHDEALTRRNLEDGAYLPPVNAGDYNQDWSSQGTFHVEAIACGLRMPFPKIKVFSAHAQSQEMTLDSEIEKDKWFSAFSGSVPVSVSKTRQKVRFEVWSGGNNLMGEERLIGETSFYAACPGRMEWRHLYGGALQSNYKKSEEHMNRGRMTPSTYRGSLFLRFSSRPTTGESLSEVTKTKMQRGYLQVKLYRGIYLAGFEGKEVSVLIQMPGCAIADPRDPSRNNFNLLSFPAKVDSKGTMTFLTEDGSYMPWSRETHGWVQRSTAKERKNLLRIPEAVNATRFYIVKRGDEDKPPEAFGKLLISMDEEREAKWMRVTWDQSVVKLPETDRLFKDDLAGYILGSATVVCPHYESSEDKNEVTETNAPHGALSEAKIKLHAKAEETKREVVHMVKTVERVLVQPVMIKPGSVLCQPCTAELVTLQVGDSGYDVQCCPQHRVQMWCHIDMLAARCLPTADPDGLGDVCYEIEVGEEGGLFDAERIRSLNPTFLHRLVIGPLWVEVKPQVKFDQDGLKDNGKPLEPKDLLDLPPIVVRMLDWDDGDKYELMGRAVVPNPDFLDRRGVVSVEQDVTGGSVKVLDVNRAHSPAWYSLEFEGQTRFIRSNAGATCDESWQNRPRLLLAAGYSFCPRWKTEKDERISWEKPSGKKCTMARIRSEEKVSYNITLDVLGLRHMGNTENPLDDGMELHISSYWSSSTNPKLRLKDGINRASSDRTFRGKGSVQQQEPDFVKCLEGLVKFQAESLDREESVSVFSPRSDFDGDKSMRSSKSMLSSHSRLEEASALESRGALVVDAGSVVGWRAKLPQYTIPVIPYLQQNRDDFQMAFMTEEGEAPDPPVEPGSDATTLAVKKRNRQHISGSDSPFVLLPDIIFQLLDGQRDHGTLCVHLPAKYGLLRQAERSVIRKAIRTRMILQKWNKEGPDYLKLECGDMVEVFQHDIKTGWAHGKKVKSSKGKPVEGEGDEGWFPDWAVDPASDKSWVELAAEEFSNLDEELRTLERLDVLADAPDACDFYVDIFASKAGKIKWNPKLQLGRCLLTQHLFSITSEDEDEKDDDVYFFNPADTLFDDPLRKDEPFDYRFCPTFSCKSVSRTDGTTRSVRSTEKPKLVWWNAQQETFYQAAKLHLETEKTMERVDSEGTSTASVMSPQGRDAEAETIPLKELCSRAALKGMRLVSKQHVPEICLPALKQNFGPEMEEIHNQTFMVPLGHEIRHDPTTWRLARLKMGRIESTKKKEKEPIKVQSVDGSTYTFSLYSSSMVKVCKDTDFQQVIPLHRTLQVKEEEGLRIVELSADREPIQVPPDQFRQLNKALDLFRIGAAEAQPKSYLQAEEKPPPNDNENLAYLNIRYRHSGTVVWVAPMEVFEWQETGSLLFVVQERSGKHVAVRLPCFDLRFPQETSWFTAKIITSRAEVAEMGQLAAQQREMMQKGKINVASGHHKEKSEINVMRDHIMVQKNSFCCRIKMMNVKGQSSRFCRPRTSNWYRCVLSSVFPEVDKLQKVHPSMDINLVKHFFLMRSMNLRRPMITSDKQKACLLKGHVSVSQVMGEDSKVEEESSYRHKIYKEVQNLLGRSRSDEEPMVKKEDTSLLPWSHLWVQSNVKIRINVLTVRGLLLDPNVSLKDVQVVMSLSGREQSALLERSFEATVCEADGRGFDIYSSVMLDALLVGEAFLSIEVRSKSSWASSNVPLGRAQIDLEDRWFALQQRRLRQASNKDWIKANRSAPVLPPEHPTNAPTSALTSALTSARNTDGGHDIHHGQHAHDYLVTAFVQPIELEVLASGP